MSSPQSLKYYSFKDITNYQDKVFTDDYCNDTFETWKFKANTTKGGKIEYKAKVKDNISSLDDELKIQFPYKDYWLWMGVRRKGDVKFHIDLGQKEIRGNKFNFFSNLKTNTRMEDIRLRIGSNYFGGHCESSNRLETNWNQPDSFCFSSRTLVNQYPYFYGYYATLNLEKQALQRYDAVIGYEKDKKTYLYLQHFSKNEDKGLGLGDVQVQGIFKKWEKKHLALSAKRDSNGDLTFQGAVQQHMNDDWWVKAKVDNKLNLNLASKWKVNSIMNLLVSAKIELAQGAQAVDFTKFTPVPFGFTCEVGF